MAENEIIWLASYPRSGNTFLRTILWHCFKLNSASIYPGDLGTNEELKNFSGHIEQDVNGKIRFPRDALPLIKTHEYPVNDGPTIYVVRDGRAACVSLWKFYKKTLSMEACVDGSHRFGLWADHVQAWKPNSRSRTLLLRYEDMVSDLTGVLEKLGDFLKQKIINTEMPKREKIADIDGRWVNKSSHWQSAIDARTLELFHSLNGKSIKEMGYVS